MTNKTKKLIERWGKPDWYENPSLKAEWEKGSSLSGRDIVERFWSLTKAGEGGCILWNATKTPEGYGKFSISHGTKVAAHRWILQRKLGGAWDPALLVIHSCDTPSCVNTDHLRQGTPADNARDMQEKGRGVYSHGESHKNAKLTDEKVREIRKMYREGRKTYKRIGEMYGVSDHAIEEVVTRRTWKHVV